MIIKILRMSGLDEWQAVHIKWLIVLLLTGLSIAVAFVVGILKLVESGHLN